MTDNNSTAEATKQSSTQNIDKAIVSSIPLDKPTTHQEVVKPDSQPQGIDSTIEQARREVDRQKADLLTLYTQMKIYESSRERARMEIGKLRRLNWKGMNKKALAENKKRLERFEDEMKKWNDEIDAKVKEIRAVEKSVKEIETLIKKMTSLPVKEETKSSKSEVEIKVDGSSKSDKAVDKQSKETSSIESKQIDKFLDKAKVYDGQGNADLEDKPIESEDEDEGKGLIEEDEENVSIYLGGYDEKSGDRKVEPHDEEEEDLELAQADKELVERVGLGVVGKGSFNDECKAVYEEMAQVIDIISMTASFGSKTSFLERYAAIGAPVVTTGEEVSNLHNQLVNAPDAQTRGLKRTWKMILVGARCLMFMHQQKCLLNEKTIEDFKKNFSGSERQVKLIQAQTLESVSEAVRLVCCIFYKKERMFVRVPLTPRVIQAHQEHASENFLMGTTYAYVKVPKVMIISSQKEK